MIKIDYETAICLAVLNRNKAIFGESVSEEEVKEYYNLIIESLNKKVDENITWNSALYLENNNFIIENIINGIRYYSFNHNFDFYDEYEMYICLIPLDVLVASRKRLPLEAIGLEKKDGILYPLRESKLFMAKFIEKSTTSEYKKDVLPEEDAYNLMKKNIEKQVEIFSGTMKMFEETILNFDKNITEEHKKTL